MAKLTWGATHEKTIENGVRRGVIYPMTSDGSYENGVAWNGIAGITLSPSGAERTSIYANDRRYLSLYSVEDLGMTVDAYNIPEEFKKCCGIVSLMDGVDIRQQDRTAFGFCYRTNVADDSSGEAGYKIQIVYSCLALPSSVNFQSEADNSEPVQYAFDISTLPVHVTGLKPVAIVVISSLSVNTTRLKDLEDVLYGKEGKFARLPFPEEVVDILSGIVRGRYDLEGSNYDECYYT